MILKEGWRSADTEGVKENLSEISEESSSETSRWSGIETVNYKISVSFVFIPFHVIEVTIHFVSYA